MPDPKISDAKGKSSNTSKKLQRGFSDWSNQGDESPMHKAVVEFDVSQVIEAKVFPANIIPVVDLEDEKSGKVKFHGGAT